MAGTIQVRTSIATGLTRLVAAQDTTLLEDFLYRPI